METLNELVDRIRELVDEAVGAFDGVTELAADALEDLACDLRAMVESEEE